MRKFPARLLAPVLPVLLAAAVLGACGGGGDTAAHRRGPDRSTSATRETTSTTAEPETTSTTAEPETTSTTAEPEAVVPTEPADASANPVTAPTPRPSGGACDRAAVYQAIRNSDAVAADTRFEITYLKCADGYGWAEIVSPAIGEGATVFFEGSGGDIALLDLGTAVCPTEDGMPESVATRLAPPDSQWRAECGLASAG